MKKVTIQELINLIAQAGPVTVMALYAMRIMDTTIKANTEAIHRLSETMREVKNADK